MYNNTQSNDLKEFKDEIFKNLRLLEHKWISEFNSKFSQINTNFEKMDLRINTLSQNNNSLLDLVTKQNYDFEKVNQFEPYKTKTDKTLITQKIQIQNLNKNLDALKLNFEKSFLENLIIPGFIGPGATYKNLQEYLIYIMEEFNKLRNDTQQNKKKVNDWDKNVLSIISKSLFKFQSNFDNKNKQVNVIMEKKYENFNNKILDLGTQIEKYQLKIDKIIKSMQNDIQKNIKIRNEYNENNDKKMEELNQKLNNIMTDFENYKKLKNKLIKNKTKSSYNNNNPNEGSNENMAFLSQKNIYKFNKNIEQYNYKLNLMNNNKNITASLDDEQKNSTINNNIQDLEQLSSENVSPKKESSLINNNINNTNEDRKNNIEKDFPILYDKQNENQIKKGRNNKKVQTFQMKLKFENQKETKNKNKSIFNNNNNSKKLIKSVKFFEEKEENKKYIDKEVITDNIQQNNNNNNQINNNNIIINNDIINNNEINNYKINNNNEKEIIKENNINNNIKRYKTQRVNKRKMNFRDFENDNLDIKDYDLTLSKNDIHYYEGSKSPESIKINANKIFSNKNNGIAPINNKNSSQSSEEISNKTLKVNINKNNIKDSQTYINLKSPNLCFTKRPENNSLSKKIKVDLKMNINIQQQQIMSKIREYYSNRKIQIEKKSTEKMVDCNVINLNLKNSKNNRQSSYSSPLSTFYSTTNSNFFSNKNNLREITSFGKTIGAFYTRKERYTRSRSLNSYEKK